MNPKILESLNPNVYWHLELQIKPGMFDSFKSVLDEMITRVKSHEPGTLAYEWSISPDKTECHSYERYADSEAAKAHMHNFKTLFAERFMACVQPKKFFVYGNPTDELKSVWPPGAVQIYEPLGGFE